MKEKRDLREKNDMEEKFMEIIAEVLEADAEELTMDIEYKVYERWDSFHMMNIIMELEEAFGAAIPLEKLSGVKTLHDLYAIIQRE